MINHFPTDETFSTEGPQCPYCGRQYTADEPGYYDENNYTEEDCDNCGKKFTVGVCHSTSWSCEAIDDGDDAGVVGSPKQQEGS